MNSNLTDYPLYDQVGLNILRLLEIITSSKVIVIPKLSERAIYTTESSDLEVYADKQIFIEILNIFSSL